MAIETERKFLVNETPEFKELLPRLESVVISQGYLNTSPDCTVRVRLVNLEEAFITIKRSISGAQCHEFEYPIPIQDGHTLMRLCGSRYITKKRYRMPINQDLGDDGSRYLVIEIDVFAGDLEGLILAEIEVPSLDCKIPKINWLGNEVTYLDEYKNAVLVDKRAVQRLVLESKIHVG